MKLEEILNKCISMGWKPGADVYIDDRCINSEDFFK